MYIYICIYRVGQKQVCSISDTVYLLLAHLVYIYIFIFMQAEKTLYFIKLYQIIIPATCFGQICRAIFRLIFRQVECTIDNHFNSLDIVLQELVKIIIIIIIIFVKGQVRSLFLNPQSGAGPSISPSVVLSSFVLLVYIAMHVLVFYFCPSSVRVVATFSGTVLFPFWLK